MRGMTGRRRKVAAVVVMDRHVGERVRLRRNMLGMSQQALGDKVGLTFQQIQKYERGGNRVSASRLHEFSRVLQVPIAFFYDDRDPIHAPPLVEPVRGDDPLTRPDSLALLAAYQRLGSDGLRLAFAKLLRALVAEVAEPAPQPKAKGRRNATTDANGSGTGAVRNAGVRSPRSSGAVHRVAVSSRGGGASRL